METFCKTLFVFWMDPLFGLVWLFSWKCSHRPHFWQKKLLLQNLDFLRDFTIDQVWIQLNPTFFTIFFFSWSEILFVWDLNLMYFPRSIGLTHLAPKQSKGLLHVNWRHFLINQSIQCPKSNQYSIVNTFSSSHFLEYSECV